MIEKNREREDTTKKDNENNNNNNNNNNDNNNLYSSAKSGTEAGVNNQPSAPSKKSSHKLKSVATIGDAGNVQNHQTVEHHLASLTLNNSSNNNNYYYYYIMNTGNNHNQLSFHSGFYQPLEGLVKSKLMPSIMLLLILASFNLPTCLSAPVAAGNIKPEATDDSVASKLIETDQIGRIHQDGQSASHVGRPDIGIEIPKDEDEEEALMLLLELAKRKSDRKHAKEAYSSYLANQQDDTLLLLLPDQLTEPHRATSSPSLSSSSSSVVVRRLIKRSGISDQRLAEIQMIRALKKQLERASKMAAASNLNSAGPEEVAS